MIFAVRELIQQLFENEFRIAVNIVFLKQNGDGALSFGQEPRVFRRFENLSADLRRDRSR